MYTVIGTLKSRTFRVLWTLEEMGLAYRHQPDGPRSDTVRAMNPSGKVPVLMTEDGPLTDSTAILTYLSDKHDQLTHAPGSYLRGKQDAITQMVLDELDSALWTAARHSFVLPEEHRLPAIKDSLRWEVARSCDQLAAQFDGPFLTGNTLTIADIICCHCLNWAANAGFPVTQEPLLAYQARMKARPAFQKLVA